MSKIIAQIILFTVIFTVIKYALSYTNFNQNIVHVVLIPLVAITVNEIIPYD